MLAVGTLLFVFGVTGIHCKANDVGPFRIIPKELLTCENEKIESKEEVVLHDAKLRKVKKDTYIYSGMLELKRGVDMNILIQADAQIFGNGGWKPNAFSETFPICEFFPVYAPTVYEEFRRYIKPDAKELCPVPKGTYPINVTVSDIQMPNLPVFPYGKYKIIGTAIADDSVIGCIGMINEVVPRIVKKKKGQIKEK